MSPLFLFSFVLGYFLLLLVVAYYTSKNSNNDSFFIGNRSSNWILVTFGMIGTSLSGVTFVSVPGTVGSSGFNYFQIVLGYFIGYMVIAFVLLPIYYRLNLTSIYLYLEKRFGITAYKTGAIFFIVSRALGATARMYLVVNILQLFVLDKIGVPFWLTAFVILLLILLYTFEGGVKTIVYTDMLQTTFMLLGLVVCIFSVLHHLDGSFSDALSAMNEKKMLNVFNTDIKSNYFFVKQILAGAFITIAMTGLDQEMMQKNISVKTLKDSQKNVMTLSVVLILVNFLFLLMGGLLYLFASQHHLDVKGDDLFPAVALGGTLSTLISVIFIIGLISALFPSADGALTALTSSFCIDMLNMKNNKSLSEEKKKKTRIAVHLSFALLFFLLVMMFKWIDDKSIIDVILKVAGYTYGPLLGMFTFGILTKRTVRDRWTIWICLLSPVIVFIIDLLNNPDWFIKRFGIADLTASVIRYWSESIFNGFKMGPEILIVNGLITFVGIWMVSSKKHSAEMTAE